MPQEAQDQHSVPIDWSAELEKNRGWMYDVARARVEDSHAVDDVMQDVSLAVIRQNGHPVDRRKVRSWLYQIVVRRTADHMRRKYGHRKLVEGYASEQGDGHDDPAAKPGADWVMAKEQTASLKIALSRLPDDEREMMTLKYTDNWSYRRLAERFGVSERVIEYRLVRAKQQLRTELRFLQDNKDES
ncbi:MAG: RNA polymerase sigma factor [Pirellulaceae bacterium]|nr:RNA polymerase sigma factor [Pirellulaceae bacterium]